MTPRPPFHWSNRPLPDKTAGWLWGFLFGAITASTGWAAIITFS